MNQQYGKMGISVKSWKSYTYKIMCVYLYMGVADFLVNS